MIVRAKQPSVLRNQNRGEQQRIVDPPPVPPPVLVGNQTGKSNSVALYIRLLKPRVLIGETTVAAVAAVSQTPRKRTRKEPAAAATTAAAAQVTATATSNNPGYGHSSAPMLMSSPLQLPPRPPSLSAGFKLFGEQTSTRHCQILLCAAEVEASKDSGKGSGGGAGNATVRAASGAGRAREGRVDSVAGQSPGDPTQHQHPPRRAGAGDGDHAGANGRERRRRRRPRHGRGRPVV
ncbi:unnamed protein product [Musa textilis]